MKILAVAVMFLIMFVIYRLLFSEKADSGTKENKTIPPDVMDGYEAVIKKRYVLPDRSKPAQHEDRKEKSDETVENANIFASGNEISHRSIIQNDELPEIFGKEVKPENLDIEKDESEMDSMDEIDAEEEAEEYRQKTAGGIEGYAAGITFDELADVIHTVDENPEQLTDKEVETLLDLTETDVFEQLISSDASRNARIKYYLERFEKNDVSDEVDMNDDKDIEFQDFDVMQCV